MGGRHHPLGHGVRSKPPGDRTASRVVGVCVPEKRSIVRCAPLTKRECFGTSGGLSLRRRLEVVRHALTCFEHWYGDTGEVRQRLTPRARFDDEKRK